MVIKPTLPPIEGYVEVDVDGVRYYKDVKTGDLYTRDTVPIPPKEPDQSDFIYTDLACMIRKGINEV